MIAIEGFPTLNVTDVESAAYRQCHLQTDPYTFLSSILLSFTTHSFFLFPSVVLWSTVSLPAVNCGSKIPNAKL